MKNLCTFFILFASLFLQFSASGQPILKWFNSEKDERIIDILSTENDTRLISILGRTGPLEEYTFYSVLYNSRYLIVTLDDELNVIDSLKIEDSDGFICLPINLHKINNGQFLISGVGYDSIAQDMQLYFLWIDEDLNIIKDTLIGDPSVLEYIGRSFSNNNNNIVIQVICNPDWLTGKEEEFRYFWEFDNSGQIVQSVVDTIGGILVPLGSSGRYHLVHFDLIYDLDAEFNLDTVYNFGAMNLELWFAKQYIDNRYFLLGNYFQGINPINPNIPDFDIILFHMDNFATYQNIYFYGTLDTTDRPGGIDFYYHDTIFIGGTKHYINGPVDNWIQIFKTGLNGQMFFENYYGGYGKYGLSDIVAIQDGGCVVSGTWWDFYNYPYPNDQRDAFIMKIGPDGIVTSSHNIQLTGESIDVRIYPNPGGDLLLVSSKMANLNLRFFDQSGKLILEQPFDQQVSINTSNLETGTYIYFIYQDKKQVKSGKWIKAN